MTIETSTQFVPIYKFMTREELTSFVSAVIEERNILAEALLSAIDTFDPYSITGKETALVKDMVEAIDLQDAWLLAQRIESEYSP